MKGQSRDMGENIRKEQFNPNDYSGLTLAAAAMFERLPEKIKEELLDLLCKMDEK